MPLTMLTTVRTSTYRRSLSEMVETVSKTIVVCRRRSAASVLRRQANPDQHTEREEEHQDQQRAPTTATGSARRRLEDAPDPTAVQIEALRKRQALRAAQSPRAAIVAAADRIAAPGSSPAEDDPDRAQRRPKCRQTAWPQPAPAMAGGQALKSGLIGAPRTAAKKANASGMVTAAAPSELPLENTVITANRATATLPMDSDPGDAASVMVRFPLYNGVSVWQPSLHARTRPMADPLTRSSSVGLPPSAETQLAAGGAGRPLHAYKSRPPPRFPGIRPLRSRRFREGDETTNKPSLPSSPFAMLILERAAQHGHAKAQGFGRRASIRPALVHVRRSSSP